MLTFRWNSDEKTRQRFPRLILIVSSPIKNILPIATLLISILLASNSHAEDQKILFFIEAQKLFYLHELREAEILVNSCPEVKSFYELWIPMKEAEQEMDLIAFKWRLSNNPNSINWENPWDWTTPLESNDEEQKLSEINIEYRTAREEFLKRRSLLHNNKHLFQLRKDAYDKNRKAMNDIEKMFTEDLEMLQLKVKDKIIS